MNRLDQELRNKTGKLVNAGLDMIPDCPVCGAGYRKTEGDFIMWECGTTLRLIPPYRAHRSGACMWPKDEVEVEV